MYRIQSKIIQCARNQEISMSVKGKDNQHIPILRKYRRKKYQKLKL